MVRFHTAQATTSWSPRGLELAWEQLAMPWRAPKRPRASGPKARSKSPRTRRVRRSAARGLRLEVDKQAGRDHLPALSGIGSF